MHRLFVALRPPPSMRRRLLDDMGHIAGARWQNEEQLHLTLRFIGEVARPLAEDIAAALGRVTRPQPMIALSGVGTFDRDGRVQSVWAGITADAALTALYDRIARALAAVGVAPERRAFHPHITLARLGRNAGTVEPFLAEMGALSTPPIMFDAFMLYESLLGRDGSTYVPVARYPLH